MGFTAHNDAAAAGFIAFAHAAQAVDGCAGREIGGLQDVDQFVDFGFGFVQKTQTGVDGVGEVMWRDVGRHTDGDTRRAVDQQRGKAGRQHQRLVFAAVVVRTEIDGFFFDVRQHFVGNFRHADFGITHGRGAVAINRAEVALTVD